MTMAIYSFVTRDDVTEEINDKITTIYPGRYFDFPGLPEKIQNALGQYGVNVKAVYTQADSGNWGTFIETEPDFKTENFIDDQDLVDEVEEQLYSALKEWTDKFISEVW